MGDSTAQVRQFMLQDPDGYLVRFAEQLRDVAL
jgi:hypothetical protein